MIGFCGYNFCIDINSLDPMPTNLNNLTHTELRNAIYDHINISKLANADYSNVIPSWDYNTIIDCNFQNNINGGNVDLSIDQVSSIKVKRREKGSFNWVVLKEVPISINEELKFPFIDSYSPSNIDYEYAIVPILSDGTEGLYIINEVHTKFDGVFISDADTIIRLYSGVSYSNNMSIQESGSLQPIGSKYPVIINNSKADYEKGTISANVLGETFESVRKIDREEVTRNLKKIKAFLKNKNPKIIKDWNGNIWMVIIVGDVSTSYNNSYGMGTGSISFDWTEQGVYDNQLDLYYNNFVDVLE